MSILEEITGKVKEGLVEEIEEITKEALKKELSPQEIIEKGFIKGMNIVGKKFKEREMFFPEVMLSAETMHKGMEILKPHMEKSGIKPKGKIIIGTVEGDLHDIGKNLVAMTLRSSGYEVIDLGVEVPPEKFISEIEKHKPHMVGMSTLLTTTMSVMEKTVQEIDKKGFREKDSLKIIVGGAPVTEDFAREISADFYAENAMEALDVINEVLKK